MMCNCENFLLRKIALRGDYLLLHTDKLMAIHKSEIKKLSTRKATCRHVCNVQYLYITTSREDIGIYMKDKSYQELLLHILDLLYPNDSYVHELFEDYNPFHSFPCD